MTDRPESIHERLQREASALAAEIAKRRPDWDNFQVWDAALRVQRRRIAKRGQERREERRPW
jgi:hypothetical protein